MSVYFSSKKQTSQVWVGLAHRAHTEGSVQTNNEKYFY